MIEGMVSIVIPTWNSAELLGQTLDSIAAQTYKNIEVIVVDRGSTDGTVAIAKKYTERVYLYGHERVEQKHYGFSQVRGEFYMNHGSDLVLPPTAIEESVGLLRQGWDGVEIDWLPDATKGFWARVRVLEMLCYIRKQKTFRPNITRTDLFKKAGGYNLGVKVAGDDYQIKIHFDRIGARCTVAKAIMIHTGEPQKLSAWVRKDIYYGKSLAPLFDAEGNVGKLAFAPPLRRYWRNRDVLLGHGPKMFFAFVFYRSTRYLCGAIGYILAELGDGLRS
jgi:glycosyltransferase involved in cell wall biosynthesis